MTEIKEIILISGKRKCGKDFITEKLQKRLSSNRCQIVRISEPIKSEWAKKLNISLEQLLSDGPFKEQYRKDMIIWSDEMRSKDFGHFCRIAMTNASADIVIVSDIRRKNDIRFFREIYGERVKTIRLTCPEEVRKQRGWIFTLGVDDVASECDLDDLDHNSWDLVLENDGSHSSEKLVELVLHKFNLA